MNFEQTKLALKNTQSSMDKSGTFFDQSWLESARSNLSLAIESDDFINSEFAIRKEKFDEIKSQATVYEYLTKLLIADIVIQGSDYHRTEIQNVSEASLSQINSKVTEMNLEIRFIELFDEIASYDTF